MLESRSSLGLQPTSGRDGADGARRLRLGEMQGWQLAQLGAFAGAHAELRTAVRQAVGLELPESTVESVRSGVELAFRIAADQFWVVTPDAARLSALAGAVSPDAGTVTVLSASRTRLVVEGAAAREFLGRLVAIDLDPRQFPIGRHAQTAVHHVGGLLFRPGADRYEFFALRTYASATWELMADAALPFGYDVFNEQRVIS
jgi:heterotetrameric sarcosine oxidase gamma subunit